MARTQGPRKPTVREMLDQLVEMAEAADCAYTRILERGHRRHISRDRARRAREADAVIFSRMDIDALTGKPRGEFFSGQDTLFIRPSAYRALRPRLRPYIIGEMPWDVIIPASSSRTATPNW